MLYVVIALIVILSVYSIVFSYQKYHDKRRFILAITFLILLLIVTYATKVVFIYKPLLVLHIALLIMAWRSFYLYLTKGVSWSYWIFSPLFSLLLFIIIALFFREHG